MSYKSTILADRPLAYYRVNETSGPTAYDSSGNGYHASVVGAIYGQPGALPGDPDTCMYFGADGGITIPYTLDITALYALSIEFWVRQTGGWHYVVITTSNLTGITTYYLDGESVSPGVSSDIALFLDADMSFSGSLVAGGYLDEFALYGNANALTAGQVAAHYAAGLAIPVQFQPLGQTPGYYVLINGRDRTEDCDINNLSITTSITDRIPQIDLTVLDRLCQNPVDIMQEVLLLDASQPDQGMNLLLDPLLTHRPLYTSNGVQPQSPGSSNGQWGAAFSINPLFGNVGTITAGTNVTMSVDSSGGDTQLYQWTQPYTVIGGQEYLFSCHMLMNETFVWSRAYLALNFYSVAGGTVFGPGGGGSSGMLGSTVQYFTAADLPLDQNTQVSCSMIAPAGTAFIQATIGLTPLDFSQPCAGTIDLFDVQLEPVWWPTLQSYPTPLMLPGFSGCYTLPNGTIIRQTRLFAGVTVDADPGSTDDTNGYQGDTRIWSVGVKGASWILDTGRVNQTFTNEADQDMITGVVSALFHNRLTTSGVQFLATIDSRNYDDQTVTDFLTDLSNTSGGIFYVNDYYDLQYLAIGTVQAPYGLSDAPDYVTTFPYQYWSCPRDGTQLQNAYIVKGGQFTTTTSDTFTATGSQKQFTLSQPAPTSVTSVTVNGTEQKKGTWGDSRYTFPTYQCLVDCPNRHLNFQNNLSSGDTVVCTYAYDGQIRALVEAPDSVAQYNGVVVTGVITDTTLTTTDAAVQRGLTELSLYAFGLLTPHFKTMLQVVPGQVVKITNSREGMVSAPFVVQKTTIVLMGGGTIEYELECGVDVPSFARLHQRLKKVTTRSKQLAGIGYSSITLVVGDNSSVGTDSCSGVYSP